MDRSNIVDLTQRPKANAGKALKALSRRLLSVRTTEAAAQGMVLLDQFHTQYGSWLNDRTYARDNPTRPTRAESFKPTHRWYTHGRDRRVYSRLDRLNRQRVLFNFLSVQPGENLHATTNIAKSVNAPIRAASYDHRGLSEQRLLTAIELGPFATTTTPSQKKDSGPAKAGADAQTNPQHAV